jgi:hypothetical protein
MKVDFELESENGAQAWRVIVRFHSDEMKAYFSDGRHFARAFRKASQTGKVVSGSRCRGGITYQIVPIDVA